MSEENRTRTYTWGDPMPGAIAAKDMRGIEYFHAMGRGDYPPPPIMQTLNFQLSEVAEGRVVFVLEPAEYHYNPIGVVHGGVAATLFDSAMGCAVHTALPAGVSYTTLEIKVNYLRPLTSTTGKVFCEGKVIQVGNRVATAEARLTDERGKLDGHATTTCLIMRAG